MYDIRDIAPLLLAPIFNSQIDDCLKISDSELFPKTDFLTSRSRKPVVKMYQGTNRNAPCPCGSGKKYKKCCIDKIMEVESNQEEQHETTN